MKVSFQNKQSGITFIGLLIIGGVLAVAGVVAAQVLPTVIEYQAVLKAVNKAKQGSTIPEIRTIFDKAASIDNISSISGKDIDVKKEGDKIVVSFAYQREIHLTGPAFLTLKYTGQSN
jgi:hypothetical protein